MHALRELQDQFASALFGDGSAAPDIRSNGIAASDRIDIYRNNLREGFLKTLALEFPATQRLVGADYFRQTGLEFLRAHPSRAGNLHHVGAPFPAFLRERFLGTEYEYLPDVAALEWAYQESMVAADAAPFDVDTLREAAPDALRLALHPAVRLVRSAYPIVRIWRANRPESASDETIDLGSGGDSVLILRAARHVEFHRLPAGQFALLERVSQGASLSDAFEAALAADHSFDLTEALRSFVLLGVFTS
jgi:hypothetical protein